MIIDTSALIAILTGEPEAPALARALEAASVRRISAPTFLEAGIIVARKGNTVLSHELDELIVVTGMIVEPFTHAHVAIALRAYREFGRGSGHPANLNFGDCFAYALAKAMREPLLFKGDDFRHTDVEVAVR